MKNKKAFTLIELLAVIVVLAIIALIAKPIVMKTIKNAADSYIKQVEVAVATERLSGNILEGEYIIQTDGSICPVAGCGNEDKDKVKIEVSGNKPESGTVTITNGQVTITSKLDMGDYEVSYDSENEKYVASEKILAAKTYANGEVVYFNVTTGTKCSDYTETQSNAGVKEGCMKFYAFNDDGGDKLNLILDHNTTAEVAWNSSGSNANGPKEILEQLKTDTSSWKGTITPSNYTIDQTGQESNAKYTIDYSDYKARLITAQEIAKITENTTWDDKDVNSWYYFDTKRTAASSTCKSGDTTGCKYGWLYDRTSTDCVTYGCLNNSDQKTSGYWTSSPDASDPIYVWGVDFASDLGNRHVDDGSSYGVRPVITLTKSQLG